MKFVAQAIVGLILAAVIGFASYVGRKELLPQEQAAFDRQEWVDRFVHDPLSSITTSKIRKQGEMICYVETWQPTPILEEGELIFSSCPADSCRESCAQVRIYRTKGRIIYANPYGSLSGHDAHIQQYDARFATCAQVAKKLPPEVQKKFLDFYGIGAEVE